MARTDADLHLGEKGSLAPVTHSDYERDQTTIQTIAPAQQKQGASTMGTNHGRDDQISELAEVSGGNEAGNGQGPPGDYTFTVHDVEIGNSGQHWNVEHITAADTSSSELQAAMSWDYSASTDTDSNIDPADLPTAVALSGGEDRFMFVQSQVSKDDGMVEFGNSGGALVAEPGLNVADLTPQLEQEITAASKGWSEQEVKSIDQELRTTGFAPLNQTELTDLGTAMTHEQVDQLQNLAAAQGTAVAQTLTEQDPSNTE